MWNKLKATLWLRKPNFRADLDVAYPAVMVTHPLPPVPPLLLLSACCALSFVLSGSWLCADASSNGHLLTLNTSLSAQTKVTMCDGLIRCFMVGNLTCSRSVVHLKKHPEATGEREGKHSFPLPALLALPLLTDPKDLCTYRTAPECLPVRRLSSRSSRQGFFVGVTGSWSRWMTSAGLGHQTPGSTSRLLFVAWFR